MTAGLSSVVFLALVSLSPCLAQRLDKGDFTVNEATGLLESPSRRPRALAFPKDSQLLVRTKTVVKDRRLMNRYRGGIAQVILFFFSSPLFSFHRAPGKISNDPSFFLFPLVRGSIENDSVEGTRDLGDILDSCFLFFIIYYRRIMYIRTRLLFGMRKYSGNSGAGSATRPAAS